MARLLNRVTSPLTVPLAHKFMNTTPLNRTKCPLYRYLNPKNNSTTLLIRYYNRLWLCFGRYYILRFYRILFGIYRKHLWLRIISIKSRILFWINWILILILQNASAKFVRRLFSNGMGQLAYQFSWSDRLRYLVYI